MEAIHLIVPLINVYIALVAARIAAKALLVKSSFSSLTFPRQRLFFFSIRVHTTG